MTLDERIAKLTGKQGKEISYLQHDYSTGTGSKLNLNQQMAEHGSRECPLLLSLAYK